MKSKEKFKNVHLTILDDVVRVIDIDFNRQIDS